MELVKLLEDYSCSVKSPELAAGGWRNMATEPDPVDEQRRDKRRERASDLARPKAIEQREEARTDPRRPQSLKDKLKRLKTKL